MHHFVLSTCSRCRLSFSRAHQPEKWVHSTQYVARRFRNTSAANTQQRWHKQGSLPHALAIKKPKPQTDAPIEKLPGFLRSKVEGWSKEPRVIRRIEAFGVEAEYIPTLLEQFALAIQDGLLERPGICEGYTLDRFVGQYPTHSNYGRIDEVLTNLFYSWASDPNYQPQLETHVPKSVLTQITDLHQAGSMQYPADDFPKARSIRRKFIMHVGPTNSGKTHWALRALAASRSGIYAGPLRLLAHEVWERLNKGQIIPLGIDPPPNVEADPNTNVGVDGGAGAEASGPVVIKSGKEQYARMCNLLTGEESKIVDETAPLLSCTIEMVSTSRRYDVAVVDEIQMLSDRERGGAWTRAVLGLYAREIHLCGEETAVPVIEALLKETGDELVVNRYQRLSPLAIQEESLKGDLRNIQKGDCIVTFSRSGIFALKRQIEELTGLRCAVAYGRLPPEIRSEQAALFNDPDSGYDVMVGSDAIGMGLNLKIKRVVFEQVHKWSGQQQELLSNSQIKQIAGRAGRYGLHGEPGGYCTTLHSSDIPVLRKALEAVIPPLQHAYLQQTTSSMNRVTSNLPPDATTLTMLEVYTHITKMRWPYQISSSNHIQEMSEFIDTRAGDLTLTDKSQLMMSPISWRDTGFVDVVATMYRQHRNEMSVNLRECGGDIYAQLEDVELQMQKSKQPRSGQNILVGLETLHKIVVFYMWMHLRTPVAWPDHELATSLKRRTEAALDWAIQGLSTSSRLRATSNLTGLRRAKERDQIEYKDSFAMRELRHEQKRIRRTTYRAQQEENLTRPQRPWN